MIKQTYITLLSLLSMLASTGCIVPGGILAERQISYRHPAVNWVYKAGGQYGWTQILMVPIPFGYPSFFSHHMSRPSVASNRIWLSEQQWRSGGCSGLYRCDYGPKRIELDLDTGRAILKHARTDQVQRQSHDVHNYKVVDANPDILLNWQDDSGTHSTKILTLKRLVQMGSGTEESERIGDTLIIYIYNQFVISVDLKVLSDSSSPRT